MFRWCAYCQQYLGQTEPAQDFHLTHGICETCVPKPKADRSFSTTASKRGEVFKECWDLAINGNASGIPNLYKRFREMGVSNSDFLFAVAARQLQQVGTLFENGQLDVRTEHRFTAFIESALSWISLQGSSADTKASNAPLNPKVLLVCAEGNYHSIGVRILDSALNDAGIPSLAIYPSLPSYEILTACEKFKPAVLGVSFSRTNQFNHLETIRNILNSRASRTDFVVPKIVCGGSAWQYANETVRSMADIEWDMKNFRELIKAIEHETKNTVGGTTEKAA